MWFNIIKADEPTQDDIERIKAVQYKSEEDKKKIKEYEQSEKEKEEREKLIERLQAVSPHGDEGYAKRMSSLNAYSNIDNFRDFIELSEKEFKRKAATEKSLGLLNQVIESNDKVTIVEEPEFKYGSIYGKVEIEGESGHTYIYDFENDPEIEKNIYFESREIKDMVAQWEYTYPDIDEIVNIPMCLSCEGDLPIGDNIATMILGLLNDDSTDIAVLEIAQSDYEVIKWQELYEHINDFIENIDLTPFIIKKFEE